MITELSAKNFKSWKDTGQLKLAPLTGFFGTNSSGKTSLIQLLLMLKQTVESADRTRILNLGDDRSLVDLGTFYDIIWGHDSDNTMELSICWKLPKALVISSPERHDEQLFTVSDMKFVSDIREKSERLLVESFAYKFDGNEFGMRRDATKKEKDAYDLLTGSFPPVRTPGRPWPLPSPVKCYGFPDAATNYFQNTGFLPDLVLALEQQFSSILYLGPLREYPKRGYLWAGERPMDVGRRGESVMAALLAARERKMTSPRGKGRGTRYKPIEERILEWMQAMGLVNSFSLKPVAKNRKDYEFRVKKNSNSSEVLITDVGFGVSQILPVLVLCYYAPEGSTVIFEQPEIHLHPSVQAALADVFIDVVKERNLQIIVESHSEHLLRRLQRRMAEHEVSEMGLSADQAALYFCKMENGASAIEKLDVDMFGNISNWPKGFFGDEMGELVAMNDAALKRKLSSQMN